MTTTSTVEQQLEERVRKLELQMLDMADTLAHVIAGAFGRDFQIEPFARLDWEEFVDEAHDPEETFGVWIYKMDDDEALDGA